MRLRSRTFALQRLAYSEPEAAEVAGVGLSHIKRALHRGELAEIKFPGNRRTLVLAEDLRQYLLRHRVFRSRDTDEAGKMTPSDTSCSTMLPPEEPLADRCHSERLPGIGHTAVRHSTRVGETPRNIRRPPP